MVPLLIATVPSRTLRRAPFYPPLVTRRFPLGRAIRMQSMSLPPPLGEQMIRDALLRLLKGGGLAPQDDWVAVRLINDPSRGAGMYVVTIDWDAARVPLSRELRRLTGGAETEAMGVWVLTESEAHRLCARAPHGAREGDER